MDGGSHSISSEKKNATMHRPPLQDVGSRPYIPSPSTTTRNSSVKCYIISWIRNLVDACVRKLFDEIAFCACREKFIRDRSSMDMDPAHYLLREHAAAMVAYPSREAYRRLRAETLLNNRTQILAIWKSRLSMRMFRLRRCGHSFFSPGRPGEAEAVHSSGMDILVIILLMH
jgi:cell division cycle protein 20 (cofactor of APC complex)